MDAWLAMRGSRYLLEYGTLQRLGRGGFCRCVGDAWRRSGIVQMERKANINTLTNNATITPNQPSLFASFLPLPRLSGIPAYVERMNIPIPAHFLIVSFLSYRIDLSKKPTGA